jgi:GNAT superfamily N-acetyltransferase
MSTAALRPMTPADADTVAALHATSWRSAYRGMLPDDFLDNGLDAERQAVWRKRLQASPLASAFGVIAEDADGGMVGFAYVVTNEDPVWGTLLDNLHVHPDAKGGGIGRQLLQAVARQLGPDHTQPLYLWVLDANEPAKRFYARLGAEFAEQETEALPFGDVALPKWRCVWRQPTSLLQLL